MTDQTLVRIVLVSRPEGSPVPESFRIERAAVPTPADGEVLLKVRYLSLDPYMRGRMSAAKSTLTRLPAHVSKALSPARGCTNTTHLQLMNSPLRAEKICFLILLKTFQRLGYFVFLQDVPKPIAEHISLLFGVHHGALEWAAYDESSVCFWEADLTAVNPRSNRLPVPV